MVNSIGENSNSNQGLNEEEIEEESNQGESSSTKQEPANPNSSAPTNAVEDEGDSGGEEGTTKKPTRKRRKKRKALFTRERPKRAKRETKADKEAAASGGGGGEDEEEEGTEGGDDQQDGGADKEEEEPELEFPVVDREMLHSFTPLQLLCDYYVRTFVRKDPEEYFTFPVTAKIAPDYSDFVTNPMDLLKIRLKVNNNEYNCLKDLKNDMELILRNAVAYNKPDTVFYVAANKLATLISYYFSTDYINSLFETLPFMSAVTDEHLGGFYVTRKKESQQQKESRKIRGYNVVDYAIPAKSSEDPSEQAKAPLDEGQNQSEKKADEQEEAADPVLIQAQAAARSARERLEAARPNRRLAIVNGRGERSTSLRILTPGRCIDDWTPGSNKDVTLGAIVPPPREGNPSIKTWLDSQEIYQTPVNFLDYGPYASFAPQLDSTWATLGKDESSRYSRTYGDQEAAEYASSLRNFVANSTNYLTDMVDSLLDRLTDGDHSQLIIENKQQRTGDGDAGDVPIDISALRSLGDLGIDVTFLDKHYGKETALQKTGRLLQELEDINYARLSQPPPATLSHQPPITTKEIATAGEVVENLGEMMSKVTPSAVADESDIQKAMGMATDDNPDIDMDVLREFFQ